MRERNSSISQTTPFHSNPPFGIGGVWHPWISSKRNFPRKSEFSRRPLRKWMTGWTTSIYGKRWAGCSGSISKENDFMGRKGVVVVGKMRVEFSVPDVLSNEPWRIFTSDQLAKWKGRSRKCSRSAGPVPYFLIWRSVFAHSEQENSTTPYHPRAYRVWKRAESEARSLENCRLKI